MPTKKDTTEILRNLRKLFNDPKVVGSEGPIQAFLVPSEDAHQSEYIASSESRREFVSGFSGSAGSAVITNDAAALWTDGRYFLQASEQLDSNWTLMKFGLPETPKQHEWLSSVLPANSRVGIDPALITAPKYKALRKSLAENNLVLVSLLQNPVDMVWKEKPSRPLVPVFALDEAKYAGKTVGEKVAEIQIKLKEKRAAALVVAPLDEVAWLLNLRGSDVSCNPVFYSYALVYADKPPALYIDERKLPNDVKERLAKQQVTVRPYDAIESDIQALASTGSKIWIPVSCNQAIARNVPQKQIHSQESPIELAKAIKNDVEVEGMRQCHIRDGAALCAYFAWLEGEFKKGTKMDEVSIASKLEEFRRAQRDFVSLSFETISSFGPNGAIIHYKPEKSTCRSANADELYLCDSGAQYLDGTTDVTRTLHFATPTEHQKDTFTRVLKGHITLARTQFPKMTTGQQLDVLARVALWQDGLDFRHGTGHGVGAFLNVHEGPHRISSVGLTDAAGLQKGMMVTNEPGYYEDGAFGIRIENVMVVQPVELRHNFGNRGYLQFETITMAPIQTKMILPGILAKEDIEWLNKYHAEVCEKVGGLLKSQGNQEAYEYVVRETQPIKL